MEEKENYTSTFAVYSFVIDLYLCIHIRSTGCPTLIGNKVKHISEINAYMKLSAGSFRLVKVIF